MNKDEHGYYTKFTPTEDKPPKSKVALITGVTGQDGSYLSEYLLDLNYTVVGITRRSATDNTQNLSFSLANPNFTLVEGDITDPFSIASLIEEYKPDEIYNLAAQSHVGTSFKQPALTWDITGKGVLNILEAIRTSGMSDHIRFYQASSSEMFGKNYTSDNKYDLLDKMGTVSQETYQEGWRKYQNEDTPFGPQSPYAIAKLAAHHLCRNYRDSYNIYACSGILFNHESPRRGESFVTRKITKWIGEFEKWRDGCPIGVVNLTSFSEDTDSDYIVTNLCKNGTSGIVRKFPKLRLWNLDAKRDWGFAGDYVKAMHLMLQQDEPDDYVIATGETYSVREFLDVAFRHVGIEDWSNYVVIDPKFFRPAEVDYLLGDPSKAKKKLGWTPDTNFSELARMMVEGDLNAVS